VSKREVIQQTQEGFGQEGLFAKKKEPILLSGPDEKREEESHTGMSGGGKGKIGEIKK